MATWVTMRMVFTIPLTVTPSLASEPEPPPQLGTLTEPKKRKKRKRKASKVSSNKEEVSILRGERHFNFKNPF
jgi:hypothetical protein